jgi:hypothetical protein
VRRATPGEGERANQALKGMRVKLRTASAESAGQHSPGQGCKAAAALGTEQKEQSPARAAQSVSPLQGSVNNPFITQGLRPGLCCPALSALGMWFLSFTRMPEGAADYVDKRDIVLSPLPGLHISCSVILGLRAALQRFTPGY